MANASDLPPTPLAELRQKSQETLANVRPSEYSIRVWSNTARVAFETADRCWREGRRDEDPRKVEEAYLEFKRAGGFMQIILKHPDYQRMISSKSPEYYTFVSLRGLATGAKEANDLVVQWLEKREAEWKREHAQAEVSQESNGVKGKEAEKRHDPIASTSRPAPPKTPSFPTATLADRLAALRASGLPGATSNIPQASPLSQTAPPPRPSTPPRQSSSRTLRQSAVPLSPASSPRAETGDLVSDNAVERTGSAPPILPMSDVQEPATVWDDSAMQFRPEGGVPITAERGMLDRGPAGGVGIAPEARGALSDLSDLPSPTRFMSAFPSVDDLERRVEQSRLTSDAPLASTSFAFPSVPSFDPSAAPSKPARPPPPAPRPARVDGSMAASLPQGDFAGPAAYFDRTSLGPAEKRSARDNLPPALRSGGGQPPLPTSPASLTTRLSSPLPPPTFASKSFKIPFSAEVRPLELWHREEYERGRIRGETVCLDPLILRDGIRSTDIEDALSLEPPHEAALFSARNHFDIVVIYDRSSATLPNTAPPSTSSDAQRTLWNLVNAIYEREFTKSLQRQPILLRGGWEAWEKQVGPQGSVGSSVVWTNGHAADESAQDTKKANRWAVVLPGDGLVMRNELSENAYGPPRTLDIQPYPSTSNTVLSPRLAMPPAVAQRSGSAPAYDPFALPPRITSRPSYSQAPLNGFGDSTSPGMHYPAPRTLADHGEIYRSNASSSSPHASSNYSRTSFEYTRPSIDYPQLQSRPPPPVAQSIRPPPPVPAVARPPPAKPAPLRSNSSFSAMQPAQYSSAYSRFPTGMLSFDEGVIGISGLKNLGNTCYMNSTIQCLSAAIPFARYFTGGTYRKDINTVNPLGTKGALANAVAELIRALWAQQYHFLSPVTFREAICRVAPQFRGSDQHDAQEFLGFLLDGLHEDCNYVLKKPPPVEMTPDREHDLETLPAQLMSEREWLIYKMRNDSFIVRLFQGQFRNQLRCLTCQKTSTTYNTFMPLSVPIPGGRGVNKVSLMACLEAFVRDEVLDKDDAWHCPRCKKNRKAIKKLSLSKLPPILVIHLKRFSFHGPFSDKARPACLLPLKELMITALQLETQVQYPLAGLDLTAFLPPPFVDKTGQPLNPGPPKGYVYDLFGVTNHYGNLSSGHYTAYVRSAKEWFNIGDSKAKSAYILYYTLRT
ncbi:ubiquitin carboxyl-terminal hydrolase 8 [Rhodotorula toruloides]|uniref:ubiquitinyl hydrolase 1 n=1 Tax=Rhodotorula toruloides TaxID=5286 RepID=A0A511KAS0_RHOTO|nr:ubiquitin carboxyl-terminal hydrolase 8 [Rhodotorula toruloides]